MITSAARSARAGWPADCQLAAGLDRLAGRHPLDPALAGQQVTVADARRAVRPGQYPVGRGEVRRVKAEPLRGRLAQQPGRSGRRRPQGRPGVRHGPAAERADVERRHAGVAHHDPDRLHRDGQFLGDHERERRAGALAGLHLAGEGGHHGIGADMHPGVVGSRRDGQPGAAARGLRAGVIGRDHGDQPVRQPLEERARVLGRQVPGQRRRPAGRRIPGSGLPGGRRHRVKQLRLLHQLGRPADSALDTRIGAAPAYLAGQRGRRPGVIRVRHLVEQRRRGHQPAGRAVTALHRAGLEPGLLHRVQDAVLGQPLDGRHPLPGGLGRGQRAGLDGAAAEQHRAGAADALAAAELGAGHPEIIAEHLEQAPVRAARDPAPGAVDDDRELHRFACFRRSLRRWPSAGWYAPPGHARLCRFPPGNRSIPEVLTTETPTATGPYAAAPPATAQRAEYAFPALLRKNES